MPPIEESDLNQDAVLWPRTGRSQTNRPIVGSPVELSVDADTGVRWNRIRRERVEADGSPLIIEAEVITDQEVTVGSLMFEGRLQDWVNDGTKQLMEVAACYHTPDINARVSRYKLELAKFDTKLPTGD